MFPDHADIKAILLYVTLSMTAEIRGLIAWRQEDVRRLFNL
jgi:hypothetical protein